MLNMFSRVRSKIRAVIKYRNALNDVWKLKDYQAAITRLSSIDSRLPPLLQLRVDLLHAFALLGSGSEIEAHERFAKIVSDADKAEGEISDDDRAYIKAYASELALLVCKKHNVSPKGFSVDFQRIDLARVTGRVKRDFALINHPRWGE